MKRREAPARAVLWCLVRKPLGGPPTHAELSRWVKERLGSPLSTGTLYRTLDALTNGGYVRKTSYLRITEEAEERRVSGWEATRAGIEAVRAFEAETR